MECDELRSASIGSDRRQTHARGMGMHRIENGAGQISAGDFSHVRDHIGHFQEDEEPDQLVDGQTIALSKIQAGGGTGDSGRDVTGGPVAKAGPAICGVRHERRRMGGY